jgi:hypothetical protein
MYPLIATRSALLKSIRNTEIGLVLLIAAFAFLGFGFCVDDLMRNSKIIEFHTRQMFEETSELIGAVLFLMSTAWALLPKSREPRLKIL